MFNLENCCGMTSIIQKQRTSPTPYIPTLHPLFNRQVSKLLDDVQESRSRNGQMQNCIILFQYLATTDYPWYTTQPNFYKIVLQKIKEFRINYPDFADLLYTLISHRIQNKESEK